MLGEHAVTKQRHRRAKIDGAIMVERGLDSGEVTHVHGRLILGTDGLYFIHGWSEHKTQAGLGNVSGGLGGVGGMLGAMADEVTNRATRQAQTEDRRRLAEIRRLSPQRQLACMPGSIHVPRAEVERASRGWSASLGWGASLRVITATQGDEHRFIIPAASRATVKAWVAAVDPASRTRDRGRMMLIALGSAVLIGVVLYAIARS